MTEMGSQALEEELQRILRVSGIESSPMDPSSMEFLRQLVQDQKQNKKKSKKKKSPSTADSRTSLDSSSVGQQEGVERNAKPAAAASNTSSAALSNSDAAMILEQLKMQTNMILSLQDKIQVLTTKVNEMEGRGGGSASSSHDTTTTMEQEARRQLQQQQEDARAGRVRIIRREVQYIPPPGQAAEAAPRQNGFFFGNRGAAPAAVAAAGPPQQLQPNIFAWFFQTTRLFWVLSRGYVRPIDGALLFKLIFMTTVVMARVTKNTSKSNKNKNNKDPKILMVSAVLMMGFLFHTRYIQYLYQFLWKQNVPGRVWKGEQNITIPPPDEHDDNHNNDPNNQGQNQQPNNNNNNNPVPPRLRGRPNNNNGEAEPVHRWWQQNDLLVGGVAPINDGQGGDPVVVNPIVAVFHGIYYLVGSFVFSIFPMWNPQGHQQRRPLREERLDDAAAAAAAAAAGDNDNNNNDNNQGIPQVRAPRDAMEAADDDSDSEGE
mmetsp:Transcript_38649/g.93434  ORF Transcript_38649/g.93434 Transcript_38649/m.93434 type:complete len:488 (+) Transcript_38649:94-1557(+)